MLALLTGVTPTHADNPISLEAHPGRVVYLDFWASWCTPCQESFPWMQTLKSVYERDGLDVIAVNLDRHRADADRFLAKKPSDLDIRFDPQGEIAETFKIKGMPTSVLIDRHGNVRFTHIGFKPVDAPTYEAQLRQLLAEK